MIVGFFVIKTS